jgi:predicted ATPase
VVLSFRPEFKPPWPEGPGLERLNLNRLDREASARIVTEIAGMPAPIELLDQLVEKADGVPLYLEELTKLVSEQGLIRRGNGRLHPARPRPALAIPATLADSLTARLDRLTDAKGVAQLGAAIGRQFSYELLEAVSETTSTLDCSSSNTTRGARPTPSNTPSSKTRPTDRCCGQRGCSITGTSRRR